MGWVFYILDEPAVKGINALMDLKGVYMPVSEHVSCAGAAGAAGVLAGVRGINARWIPRSMGEPGLIRQAAFHVPPCHRPPPLQRPRLRRGTAARRGRSCRG